MALTQTKKNKAYKDKHQLTRIELLLTKVTQARYAEFKKSNPGTTANQLLTMLLDAYQVHQVQAGSNTGTASEPVVDSVADQTESNTGTSSDPAEVIPDSNTGTSSDTASDTASDPAEVIPDSNTGTASDPVAPTADPVLPKASAVAKQLYAQADSDLTKALTLVKPYVKNEYPDVSINPDAERGTPARAAHNRSDGIRKALKALAKA